MEYKKGEGLIEAEISPKILPYILDLNSYSAPDYLVNLI
jgi:hypothetical protein